LRNHLEMTITASGKAPRHRAGYTLTIVRKQGGRWLLARDANLVS
jgi:hypothetical protein